MILLPRWLTAQRGTIAVATLLAVFILGVLVPGFQLAGRLDDTAAALRLVSEQRRQPDVLASALLSVRDRLETYGYVDEPLAELRSGLGDVDTLVQRLRESVPGAGTFEADPARAVRAAPRIAADVAALQDVWGDYRRVLVPVADFRGMPYTDSEATGTQLNPIGRDFAQRVVAAIAASRVQTPVLLETTGRVSAALEAESTRLSAYLRLLMLVALVVTSVLGATLTYFVVARRRESARLVDARRQTEDIFATVREGLFLLDKQSKIGAAHSASLARLFKRTDLAGLTFSQLLQPLVPEKTLNTALKFVQVLWSERTNENLVRSINPLQEVEVSFEDGSGRHETRWLEFDFHRVRRENRVESLLVSVNDVSSRVRLALELAESREKAQSQLDTLLGILHLGPEQVRSFLDDSDAAMKMVNAVLREPARDEHAFRRKLDSISCQVHAVKGESAALGLSTIESRAHEFEDSLKELRERTALSGADFLPLVVKLDDLFTHLASVRDLVGRLQTLRLGGAEPVRTVQRPTATTGALASAAAAGAHAADGRSMPKPSAAAAAAPPDALSRMLDQLVTRLARDRGKHAHLAVEGLALVPADYRRAIKDIAVQVVRNALVHGIEDTEHRIRAGKPGVGMVRIEFRAEGAQGYRLVIEDDGAGLSPRRIRETAVKRGWLTTEEAARLDLRQLMALLFRPGFSTQEVADEDAGRGVGMNVVAESVKALRGRIAVASGEGRYTRFTIALPPEATADAA